MKFIGKGFVFACLLWLFSTLFSACDLYQEAEYQYFSIYTLTRSNKPVPGILITLHYETDTLASDTTDIEGLAEFPKEINEQHEILEFSFHDIDSLHDGHFRNMQFIVRDKEESYSFILLEAEK